MSPKHLSSSVSVSSQLAPGDLRALAASGYDLVISNRYDHEESGQTDVETIHRQAGQAGLRFVHIPVTAGGIVDDDVRRFAKALDEANGPVHAFCRTGARSAALWALSQAGRQAPDKILAAALNAGHDLTSLRARLHRGNLTLASEGTAQRRSATIHHDVVIVGGGSAGIATAASLRARDPKLDIAIFEPREEHFYQPGWTMVGAGILDRQSTCRPQASVIPKGVYWRKDRVTGFRPVDNEVDLEDGRCVGYRMLVVAPGITLDWGSIAGLQETLGHNGVTSNYDFETASYTWTVAQNLREGVALFTQPPMPIKCAGAPQKAMYLSCDHWKRTGALPNIDVAFHNAGSVLFGVKEYVPALMHYVVDYGIDLQFDSRLIAVDGRAQQATFSTKTGEITRAFDMLHVCPPQKAPDFVAQSPLADHAGYVEVDPATLRHVRYDNIFALGDGSSTSNAKTAAAVRKQAPVVAINLLATLSGKAPAASYDGYGSCPLTVERGRIVLAEFGYGGKLLPSFPKWLIDGEKPQRLSWSLKAQALPWIYWNAMLKGREWLASPRLNEAV